MSDGLAELALILLAWAIFAAAVAASFALAWPRLARRLRRLAPAPRARVAARLALAPTLVPALLVALCLAPGLPARFGGHGDHCLAHRDHPHLCLAHRSDLTPPLAAWLALAGIAATGAS